jgi:predicted N-acetyltransferase YhbS
MTVKIRPATKREVGRFFRAVNRSHMRSETDLLSASRLALADEFFVAIIDGKIVGAVCLVLDNGECAELLTEYVLKEHQGQGIGTRLTKTGIERLISIGRTPIYVDVASEGMDRTLDKLPEKVRRHLRLNKAYLKYGEVDLPEV